MSSKKPSPAWESHRSYDEEEQSSSDIDFGQLLDQFEQEQALLEEGEVVRGTVVGLSERGVVIEFGYKSEGIVNPAEFTENGRFTVKAGDEVEVLVKSTATADGLPVLSRFDAIRIRAWDDLEQAHRDGSNVKGRVIERIKGGLRVDVDGIAAFLPGSQIDVRPVRNLDSLLGQLIEARVIKVNRKRSNVVLSRKALLEQENNARKSEILQQLKENDVVEGHVKTLTDYGAFVDLGGVDGLLHVTDMAWGRVQSPQELFRVGSTILVKVLKIDRERERISLGYKQLLPDPWSNVEERYPVGTRVSGRVARLADFGAFVELESGVEGLVHISEMSLGKSVQDPSKVFNPGDMVEVTVLSVHPRARRISLGLKQMPLPAGSERSAEEDEVDFLSDEPFAQPVPVPKEFEETFFQFRDSLGEQAAEVFRQTIDSEAIAQRYVFSRYQLLVNRKHVSGLSTGEIEELDSLTQALDEMDEPYYQRVINTLQSLVRSKKA